MVYKVAGAKVASLQVEPISVGTGQAQNGPNTTKPSAADTDLEPAASARVAAGKPAYFPVPTEVKTSQFQTLNTRPVREQMIWNQFGRKAKKGRINLLISPLLSSARKRIISIFTELSRHRKNVTFAEALYYKQSSEFLPDFPSTILWSGGDYGTRSPDQRKGRG